MRRVVLLAAALLLAVGCTTVSSRHSMPPAARDWIGTLSTAKEAASDGRYADADKLLYDFAQRFPRSPESREATYWRAVFKLDPQNPSATPRGAIEDLDDYLADSSLALHRTEAEALRRLAVAVDSMSHTSLLATTTLVVPPDTSATAQAHQHAQELEKEVARLRDSLDKTSAELERIKKRLAPAKPAEAQIKPPVEAPPRAPSDTQRKPAADTQRKPPADSERTSPRPVGARAAPPHAYPTRNSSIAR